MKIAMIAALEECVPPKKYGGTELVVYNLIEQLVSKGHEVTLLGAGGSETSARLWAMTEKPIRKMPGTESAQFRDAYKYMGVAKIVTSLRQEKFDVVHNHLGWRLLPYLPLIEAPAVTTLHGPLDVPYQQTVYGQFATANYISISQSQRRPMPSLNFVANVYNGIKVEAFKYKDKPGSYLAFLGRMSPEKGPVQAIKIAKQAGWKLRMAAKVDAVDKIYFEREVKPLIDGKQIEFIGEVGHEDKVKLLSEAAALMAPIQWEEPFGLFFVEAMVCGTPVITMRRGSAPEVVAHGKTGFTCASEQEAVAAVGKLKEIERKACRQRVEELFSDKRMAEGYEQAYLAVREKGN